VRVVAAAQYQCGIGAVDIDDVHKGNRMGRISIARLWIKMVAIVGCAAALPTAHAVPLFYDEAASGDINATIGNIPLFNLDVGNNVIAGTHSIAGESSGDFDIFSFVVPVNSVLRFVTVEFGDFDFTGELVGFGPNFQILQDIFTGPGRFIDTSHTPTSDFTDVLTSVGPQNLFTRLPVGSGVYDWINQYGRAANDLDVFAASSARWNYRLTFGVESIAVPEPSTLAIAGLGFVAVFIARRRRWRHAQAKRVEYRRR
jgi:hypothetical protein